MKEKIKLVIVFVLGIMISVVISVYAATVIGASEVSYTDNKGIGASNVQDAINGVYSSANTLASRVSTLDTRVSTLEGNKRIRNISIKSIGVSGTAGSTVTKTVDLGLTLVNKSNTIVFVGITRWCILESYELTNTTIKVTIDVLVTTSGGGITIHVIEFAN